MWRLEKILVFIYFAVAKKVGKNVIKLESWKIPFRFFKNEQMIPEQKVIGLNVCRNKIFLQLNFSTNNLLIFQFFRSKKFLGNGEPA